MSPQEAKMRTYMKSLEDEYQSDFITCALALTRLPLYRQVLGVEHKDIADAITNDITNILALACVPQGWTGEAVTALASQIFLKAKQFSKEK